jgi:hypothetical protein
MLDSGRAALVLVVWDGRWGTLSTLKPPLPGRKVELLPLDGSLR